MTRWMQKTILRNGTLVLMTLLAGACGREMGNSGGGGGGGGGGGRGGYYGPSGSPEPRVNLTNSQGDSFQNGDNTRSPQKQRFRMESYERFLDIQRELKRDGRPGQGQYLYPDPKVPTQLWDEVAGYIS